MNSMAPSVKQNFYRDQKRSIQKKSEVEKVVKRRIYLENYNPANFLSIADNFDPYYAFTKEHTELVSEHGLYRIDQTSNNVSKLNQVDLPTVKRPNFIPGKHIIVDYSHFEQTMDISQLPVEHTPMVYTSFNYCFYGTDVKRSLLYLVVEGTFREKPDGSNKNRYKGFIPTDIYFISDEDIDNVLIKKELNEFLLMLI
jgi:hypothetical protein